MNPQNTGMRVDDRIEEGVEEMCNMGDYIEAKAIKKDPNGLFKSTQCGQNAISDKSLFELTL